MEEYDVVVLRFETKVNRRELPIPGLQRIFGLDREAALKVMQSLPCVVRSSVTLEVAEKYGEALGYLGAEVKLRPSRGGSGKDPVQVTPADSGIETAAEAPGSKKADDAPPPRPSPRPPPRPSPRPPPRPSPRSPSGPDPVPDAAGDGGAVSPAPRKPGKMAGAGSRTYPLGTIDGPGQGRGIAELPTQPDAGQMRDEAMKLIRAQRASGALTTEVMESPPLSAVGSSVPASPPVGANDSGGEEQVAPELAPVEPEEVSASEPEPPDEQSAKAPPKWASIDLFPAPVQSSQQGGGQQEEGDLAEENGPAGKEPPPKTGEEAQGWISPVAWTGARPPDSSPRSDLDLIDTDPDHRSDSERAAAARAAEGDNSSGQSAPAPVPDPEIELELEERPIGSRRPASEAAKGASAGDKVTGSARLRAPNPMRDAVITDTGQHNPAPLRRRAAVTRSQEGVAGSRLRRAAMPALLRFWKPGTGDALGGLGIVVLGFVIGGSIFLGSPGVTDVIFDAVGISWFATGVYKLTAARAGSAATGKF